MQHDMPFRTFTFNGLRILTLWLCQLVSASAADAPIPLADVIGLNRDNLTLEEFTALSQLITIEQHEVAKDVGAGPVEQISDILPKVRASRITHAIRSLAKAERPDLSRLVLQEVEITGDLDLRDIKMGIPLVFRHVRFGGRLLLTRSTLQALEFFSCANANTHVHGQTGFVEGDSLETVGDIIITDSPNLIGEFRLAGAKIGKDLFWFFAGFDGR